MYINIKSSLVLSIAITISLYIKTKYRYLYEDSPIRLRFGYISCVNSSSERNGGEFYVWIFYIIIWHLEHWLRPKSIRFAGPSISLCNVDAKRPYQHPGHGFTEAHLMSFICLYNPSGINPLKCEHNCCQKFPRFFPADLFDDNPTLVSLITWCRQATSHYLIQYRPMFMKQYNATRSQWDNTSRAYTNLVPQIHLVIIWRQYI